MSATQRANLLRLLISRRGEWIPACEVADAGGLQYGARLYELRHEQGYEIESRTQRVRTGVGGHSVVKHSWFKLLTDREALVARIGQGKPVSRAEIEALKDEPEPTLFDISPTGHRDEN